MKSDVLGRQEKLERERQDGNKTWDDGDDEGV